jgi:hypothetical protein
MRNTHKWHVVSAFEFLYLFDECVMKGYETFLKQKLLDLQHIEDMLFWGNVSAWKMLVGEEECCAIPMVPNLLTSEPQGCSADPESLHDLTGSLPSSQGMVVMLFFVIVVVMYEIRFPYNSSDWWHSAFCHYVFSNITWILKYSYQHMGSAKFF